MQKKEISELITLDGNELLTQYQLSKRANRPVALDVDLYANVSQYSESALAYQIKQVLNKEPSENEPSEKLLSKVLFFINFENLFQYGSKAQKELFTELVKEGFEAVWKDSGERFRYVPFEKSQSQTKHCVISFIRQDLFLPVRKRLDLDIAFGDYKYTDEEPTALHKKTFELSAPIAQLSKLYAYRGLYLTEAVRLEKLQDLLTENRIVILRDDPISPNKDSTYDDIKVYTAVERAESEQSESQKDGSKKRKGVKLEGQERTLCETKYEFSPFDGVGLISPRGAALLNQAMDPKTFEKSGIIPEKATPKALSEHGMAVSFQFRMPFCKGMLHTVDFHGYFKKELNCSEDCWVEDIFGVRRNLKDADIILNQNLFKLYGLVKDHLDTPERRKELIRHYFEKIKEYGHSLYIVKTDREQRHTGYVHLTEQIINSLPFEREDFELLLKQHKDRAMQYRLSEVLINKGKLPVLEENNGEAVRKYIAANYCLALDEHVESLIDSCREQALNEMFLGNLDVQGDLRFLSRDLLYYLHRIGTLLKGGKNSQFEGLPRGKVYMPGEKGERECALFRSPHLCPNENVMGKIFAESKLYKTYLGHLQRVVFIAHNSGMADALGGADFDGDTVVVAFQLEVIKACQKICYREDGAPGLPLIQIPSLKGKSTPSVDFKYVNPDVLENTFSNQIGIISNATMKIYAAEALTDKKLKYSSSYCAILNGVEIDAAKTGVRPDLADVLRFIENTLAGRGQMQTELSDEAKRAMQLVSVYLKIRSELKGHAASKFDVTEDKNENVYNVKFRGETLASIPIPEEGESVPFVYRLLTAWAEILVHTNQEETKKQKERALESLKETFPDLTFKKNAYPRQDVLEKVVFQSKRVPQKVTDAITTVFKAYATVKKTVNEVYDYNDEDRMSRLRKNLVHLLQYKYDDVDMAEESLCSLREVGTGLGSKLAEKLNATEKLSAELEDLFYARKDTAWLFRGEEDRKNWLAGRVDEQATQVAGDFGFLGYNLVYFALQEQYLKKAGADARASLETKTDDNLVNEFYEAAQKAVEEGYSAAQFFNRKLIPLCRKKLKTLTEGTKIEHLIPRVYKETHKKDQAFFWKVFSWEEIEAYIRGGAEEC